jgi:uncharacterized membrane protein YwaF
MAGKRPGGVTLVAVLAWISGILTLIGGIIMLFGGGAFTLAGIISIIIGIITIAVGVGLLRANNSARIVATIVFILNLANAVYSMFADRTTLTTAIVGAALAIIGIIILYTRRANEFFGTA